MKIRPLTELLITFLIAVVSPAVLVAADAPATAKLRPNIIFMFSDDHAYQAISAYGRALNQTPNIDRLASEGMRFDRCLTTYSLCGPSRACVLTGKYSHLNGFYNNYNSRFDGSQVTMPKLLQAAGYNTAIIGKWHLESDPTGFDFWEILPGQGQYYNPPMIRMGEKVKKQGYVTEIIADDSLEWLKNGRDKSKPFLLMLQQKAPHREWEPSIKHLMDYDGVKFPEPSTLFDDYSGRGKAEHEQDMMIKSTMTSKDLKLTPPPQLSPEQRKQWDAYYEPRNEAFRKANLKGDDLIRWKYQRYMHDYMATVASVDEGVGRVLDYLKESGLDDNTIVIYSSDQGFYLGEHGWFDKRWIFEESLRTPLLVRWPGVVKPRTTSSDIVSNLDYAETLLDAAGIKPPAEMQGRSLVPVLKGETPADWRKSFYYHYYEHPAVHNVAKQYGVITDRYKLVHFYEKEFDYWELFDLSTDPYELKSVYDDPRFTDAQKQLHAELDRLRKELKVPEQDVPAAVIPASNGEGKARPTVKALDAWVLDYHFDKDTGDKVIDASGLNHHGVNKGTTLGERRDGKQPRTFDGKAFIDVGKSSTLNPGVPAWTVEVTFNAAKPEGVIIGHGGISQGYCLSVAAGKPVFTLIGNSTPTRVTAPESVLGRWVTVRASYTESEVTLEVDGKPVAKANVAVPLLRNPADGLQIGTDTGSYVLGSEQPPFTGLIESVRMYSGVLKSANAK